MDFRAEGETRKKLGRANTLEFIELRPLAIIMQPRSIEKDEKTLSPGKFNSSGTRESGPRRDYSGILNNATVCFLVPWLLVTRFDGINDEVTIPAA